MAAPLFFSVRFGVGLSALAGAATTTVVLMLVLFFLSNLVLLYGLAPLSGIASPLSGCSGLFFYLLIMPGTVIHELSHLGACVLSRVRVFDVQLFKPQPNGVVGLVVYERCDPVRRNFIAFAPFLGGSLSLYLVMAYTFVGSKALDLTRLTPRLDDMATSLGATLNAVMAVFANADLTKWSTWLFFYLVFSIGFGIAPSKADLSNLLADGLLLIGISLGLYLADTYWHLGLLGSDLVNGLAAGLAGLLQRLNALLLFSGVVIGLGTLFLVPMGALLRQLRGGQ